MSYEADALLFLVGIRQWEAARELAEAIIAGEY
jgi:hypothetical protein